MLTHNNFNSLFSRFSTLLLTSSFFILSACGGNNFGAALPDDTTQEEQLNVPPSSQPEGSLNDKVISDSEKMAILQNYDHVDPTHIVPYQSLEKALLYFHQNKSLFPNSDYISIINFAQNSKEKRFFIINLKSGAVWAIHVAHGKGSDPDRDGMADKFSNSSGSNASSLGVYRTAETYQGKHGLSLRLDGMSPTNSNARARAVVIHGASYVQEATIIQGRSWGCPAVSMDLRDDVIKYLKNGTLIFAAVDNGGTQRPAEPDAPVIARDPASDFLPTPGTPGVYNMKSLAWEVASQPQRKQWSQYLMKSVLQDWPALLKGTDDMVQFCPRYYTLGNNDKANVWAQLFAAIAKYESAFNPLSRMQETTMGTDPVTKRPVYSEGLLQLSYQDMQGRKFCKFDWSKDKALSPTDPKKTILDPYKNLECGVGIMAKQVERYHKIAIGSGAYWAVIKSNSRYQKISSIAKIVKTLPLCQ